MRIKMRDWNGVKVAAEYVTKMVRESIAVVTRLLQLGYSLA